MQAVFELLAGFIILLVAACLSQFGLDLKSAPVPEREVHRIADCPAPSAAPISIDRYEAGC